MRVLQGFLKVSGSLPCGPLYKGAVLHWGPKEGS